MSCIKWIGMRIPQCISRKIWKEETKSCNEEATNFSPLLEKIIHNLSIRGGRRQVISSLQWTFLNDYVQKGKSMVRIDSTLRMFQLPNFLLE
jgi:hypothetical protein